MKLSIPFILLIGMLSSCNSDLSEKTSSKNEKEIFLNVNDLVSISEK